MFSASQAIRHLKTLQGVADPNSPALLFRFYPGRQVGIPHGKKGETIQVGHFQVPGLKDLLEPDHLLSPEIQGDRGEADRT